MLPPDRITAGPGQESVWDYPRPPRLEPVDAMLRVVFAGRTVAETRRGYRVLETSHPPSYYFPPEDVNFDHVGRAQGASFCEWKGEAIYWSVRIGNRVAEKVAWSYPSPTPDFAEIVDRCVVGEIIGKVIVAVTWRTTTAVIVGRARGGGRCRC